MESLFNLKGKEDIYSKLIFAHDLTHEKEKSVNNWYMMQKTGVRGHFKKMEISG